MLNAQRSKSSQKVWDWTDFFNDTEVEPQKPMQSAKEVDDLLTRVGMICQQRR